MTETLDKKKKIVRFTPFLDIQLLREVVALNPYEDTNRWTAISQNLNDVQFLTTTARTVRERVQLLVEKWRKEEMDSLKRSGTDEEFTEREQLLTEVASLIDEAQQAQTKQIKKETKEKDKERECGLMIREVAMNSLKDNNDNAERTISPPPTKKRALDGYLQILAEREENQKTLKEEELNVRKEELKLEREKFEMEKEERSRKLELEIAKEKLMLELLAKNINK